MSNTDTNLDTTNTAPGRDVQRPLRTPAIDILESEAEYLLVADVAGATTENVSLHLEDDHLTLVAVRGAGGDATPSTAEYPETDYRRTLVLPDGIDYEQATASLKDGVLSVHIPKAASARPRRIEVQAG